MSTGFFLNPTLIQEILLWRSHTAENLQVFEPIARACASLGSLLLPDDESRAAQITQVLQNWCSSPDFECLLAEARKSKSSISMALGRETLSQFSGSASFVVGVPIDEVLSAFSALIRADLRSRESRSIARIDEIFLWQSCFKRLSLHDICLLILSSFASKNVMGTFDRLLAIKDDPTTLSQIDSDLLSTNLSPQFTSGMRLFALANYEGSEKAYGLAIDKDPQSPSVYLALCLQEIIGGKYEEARRLIGEAQQKSDSGLLLSITHLINILAEGETPEPWANDPISVALASFFLLRDRQYARVLAIAEKHLQEFPKDLIMQVLTIEALLLPVRDELYNDPPLPGGIRHELAVRLDDARIRLATLAEMSETMGLSNLKSRAQINLSCVTLAQRDFKSAAEFSESILLLNPRCAEAKVNLAITMLATGDLPRAMHALLAMPPEMKTMGMRLAAEAHYHACAFEPAIDLWKRLLPDDEDRLWRLRTLCRMLEVYRLLRDAKNAQNCVDTMLTEFQHEPETIFALGYELWQMNRLDDAINALRRAKDLSAPNLQKWEAWELGRVLFDADKPLAATDEYVSIAEKDVDSVQAREFCVALYRAGLMPAAFERARSIRQAHGEVMPGITEIETDFLVRENKLAEAKDLLRALSLKRPLSILNRLAVVRICTSLGQEDEAREELQKICQLELSEEMQQEVERFCVDLDLVISIKGKQSP